MLSGGILISSLEFPGKISLVVFTGGCMLRCPYCHNPDIIDGGEEVSLAEIKEEIDESQDFIDAVVITGGEPLLQADDVKTILLYAKDKGLLTKLDTNGYYPERIDELLHLIDYVALDVKAPFNRYHDIIGSDIGDRVKKSMQVVNNSGTFLECRTTFVPGLLTEEDAFLIAENIDCDLFTLQQFRNRVVLDDRLKKTPNTKRSDLLVIAQKIKPVLGGLIKIKTGEFGDEII